MADGWAFRVTTQYLGSKDWGAPELWYAYISDQAEAEKAVRKVAPALETDEGVRLEVAGELSASSFKAYGIEPGNVRQP